MPVSLRIERLVAGGDGLARDDEGRVVFVGGALPGELVEVDIVDQKRDFRRAVVTHVVEPSPERRVPPCSHRHDGCGGCGWMHLVPSAQLVAKVEIVRESLRRVAKMPGDRVDEMVVTGRAVEPVGSRTTVRVVGAVDGRAGFRKEGSHEVVPVDACQVAHPRLSGLVHELRLPPGWELSLRTSVATGESTARWEGRSDPNAPIRGLPHTVQVGPRAWIEERVAGEWFRVSAGSFFQAGPAAAELLIDAVARASGERARGNVVDAYGGVGLFALTALRDADRVTLVESSRSACRDAEHNLAGVAAAVVRSEFGHWRPRGSVDLIVADPARTGLGRPGVEAVDRARPAAVVLVSCDPGSLARDTALLCAAGYLLRRVEVLDLFPETPHVEAVSLFEGDEP